MGQDIREDRQCEDCWHAESLHTDDEPFVCGGCVVQQGAGKHADHPFKPMPPLFGDDPAREYDPTADRRL